MKLISLRKFVLETHGLTTTEFCLKHKIPTPSLSSVSPSMTNELLRIDAIKQRFFVEYAQFLSKKVDLFVLIKELGFGLSEGGNGRDIELLNNGYCILHSEGGYLWLSSYDATDGREVHIIEDLVGLDIEVNFDLR